jgi:hypothetical protein
MSPVSWPAVFAVLVASGLWFLLLATHADFPTLLWIYPGNTNMQQIIGFTAGQLVIAGIGIAVWRETRPRCAGILVGVLLSCGLYGLFMLCSQVWLVT